MARPVTDEYSSIIVEVVNLQYREHRTVAQLKWSRSVATAGFNTEASNEQLAMYAWK